MKERPIIFSAPMVRAILSGTKTQTRRVVRKQFADDATPAEVPATTPEGWQVNGHSGLWWDDGGACFDDAVRCPFGMPGDQLWVREAWAPGDWLVFGSAKDDPETVLYRADQAALHWDGEAMRTPMDTYAFTWDAVRWKPSIHMPSWASRITLEITSVRVERLHDISEADAVAEGVTPKWEPGCSGQLMEAIGGFSVRPAASAYADLWESLHGPGSWDANPWVWVVEFKRINQASPQL